MTLFSDPFRPFFLLGALQAALGVPLWLLLLGGTVDWPMAMDPLSWHVHEMLFGFLGAVLAGFLFTAIPNWTGRLPLRGRGLALLVALWFAGRLAMLAPLGSWMTGIVDASFLVVVAALAWREVLAGRNWRNAPICLLVTLFAAANVLFHSDDLQGFGQRLALAVAGLLIALVGGRIVPSFTRNWLAKRSATVMPAPFGRFDRVCLIVLVAALAGWLVAPDAAAIGWGMVAAALLHGARLARWRGLATLSEPLVAVLHAGYLWLVAAFAMIGLSILAPAVVSTGAALHALSAGAVGTTTLAVMTRASLGHSGRPLVAGPATVAMYLLVVAGAALRLPSTTISSWLGRLRSGAEPLPSSSWPMGRCWQANEAAGRRASSPDRRSADWVLPAGAGPWASTRQFAGRRRSRHRRQAC